VRSLRQGQVVRARVYDPQGRNPKIRPLVIVSPNQDIRGDAPLLTVAVTSRFTEPLSADEVELPWHPLGQAHSGLTVRCVAKCRWMVKIRSEDVMAVKGFLPKAALEQIIRIIATRDD